MKTIILISLILASESIAQPYFPLLHGDHWSFMSDYIMNEGIITVSEVMGDTTLNNGKKYALLTGSKFGSNFLRQENQKVFAFDVLDSAEYLLLDFSAKASDTICVHSRGTKTILALGGGSFLEITNSPSGNSTLFWQVVDSVGLVTWGYAPNDYWYLTYAFISGKKVVKWTGVAGGHDIIPSHSILEQNYPNPFNISTMIRFYLPVQQEISLGIYNLLGQSIQTLANQSFSDGWHELIWDAASQPTGVYYIRLSAKSTFITRTVMLLK